MDILRTGYKRKVVLVAAILVVAAIMGVTSSLAKTARATRERDQMKEQARELRMAINGVGNSCSAISRVFLRGVDRAVPAVYWGAACSDGQNYHVRVTSDRVRVTDCALLISGATECFSPLTQSAILLDRKNTAFREAPRAD